MKMPAKNNRGMELLDGLPPDEALRLADKWDPAFKAMRRDYLNFAVDIKAGYDPSGHIELITRELMKVKTGETRRLMLFLPPRHSKTETAVVRFIPWWLGNSPDDRIMYVTYGATLAQNKSKNSRSIMRLPLYSKVFPDARIDQESRAKARWDIEDHEGGVQACGIDGAITGEGADLLIIDDPIKNRAEAESERHRSRVETAYRNDVATRLEPEARQILMTTRWHQDDLAGALLKERESEWKVIKLPAIAIEGEADLLNRQPGEALWPTSRGPTGYCWPLDKLFEHRDTLGSYAWTSLYQQSPIPPEGALVKYDWIKWYDGPTPPGRHYAGVDTATSQKTAGHDSAMCESTQDDTGWIYITHGEQGQYSITGFADLLLDRHKAKGFQIITFELNNAGEAIRQHIDERGRTRGIYPPIWGVTATMDKTARLLPTTPLIENGTIRFNQNDPWVVTLVDHLTSYRPGDDFDDVDCFVWNIYGITTKAASGEEAYATPRVGNYRRPNARR